MVIAYSTAGINGIPINLHLLLDLRPIGRVLSKGKPVVCRTGVHVILRKESWVGEHQSALVPETVESN
jgi:hypothetical protein